MNARRGVRRIARGFTLIELLVVIIILAILAAVVIPKVIGRTEDARQGAARSEISVLAGAVERYKLDTTNYPNEDQGLSALIKNDANDPHWKGPYIEGDLPTDPWGKPYTYKYPGAHGDEPDISTIDAEGNTIESWNLKK